MIHAFGYWLLSDSDLGLIIFAFALLGVAIGTQIGRAWAARQDG